MTRPKGRQWADHYTEKAKKENYPARSVYKLKEIDEKFHLIKKRDHILDLGCSPGSWLLYASEKTGPKGKITGIDLKPLTIHLPPHVKTIEGDIFFIQDSVWNEMNSTFDLVISDMAPDTTGNRWVDAIKSYDLSMQALAIANRYLKKNGGFVCKIFESENVNTFSNEVKTLFEQMKRFKPKSSRKESKEIFIIGMGKK